MLLQNGAPQKFASEELSYKTPLKLSSFEDFSLSYYPTEKYGNGISPRERMKGVYEFCRDYAADFSTESPNLLCTEKRVSVRLISRSQ